MRTNGVKANQMPEHKHKRVGFTLVELLVVIAIIGILVALLLPAVQAARESARRSQCTNNLKQLGLAVLNFESAQKMVPFNRYSDYGYPTAWGTSVGPGAKAWSWIAAILPYIESNELYEQGGVPNQVFGNNVAVGVNIPMLFCPSDEMKNFSPISRAKSRYMAGVLLVALTNYKGVLGSNYCWGPWANIGTNSLCEPWASGDGILPAQGFANPIKLRSVSDGTSKTFLAGEQVWNESRSSCPTPDCYGMGFSWAHTIEATATTAIYPNIAAPGVDRSINKPDLTIHNGFNSMHPGGLQFVSADGSVRFISDSISIGVYRAQGTIKGGEALDFE